MSLAKAVGVALSGVIFILSLAILIMWLYMLKVNSAKACEMQKRSDSLAHQDDPDTVGAKLFAELYPMNTTEASSLFKQLVVHRDNSMFLNCILKDLGTVAAAKRLELINIIVRCNTPLDCAENSPTSALSPELRLESGV